MKKLTLKTLYSVALGVVFAATTATSFATTANSVSNAEAIKTAITKAAMEGVVVNNVAASKSGLLDLTAVDANGAKHTFSFNEKTGRLTQTDSGRIASLNGDTVDQIAKNASKTGSPISAISLAADGTVKGQVSSDTITCSWGMCCNGSTCD